MRPTPVEVPSRGCRPADRVHRSIALAMDTAVSVEVVSEAPADQLGSAMQRALAWFGAVEAACSRFDPGSELRQLLRHVGRPVPASPLLFEAVQFALALARSTAGAFDTTVGRLLEARGFDRDYRTGRRTASPGLAPRG